MRKRTEQTAHGTLYDGIVAQAVGNIDKGYIEAQRGVDGIAMTHKPICLAHTTPHGHTVDSMPQSLLRHGYEKGNGSVGAAALVVACHYAQGIGQC